MGNTAGATGLALLMLGDSPAAAEWFSHAADRYRESYPDAPPGNWEGASRDAGWALDEGAAAAESPIGRYAACLALLVLERWQEARVLADALRTHDGFPPPVGDTLAAIAAEDPLGYVEGVERVLESFETRSDYLEDMPVADTVLVLQALAGRRGLTTELASPLLPAAG